MEKWKLIKSCNTRAEAEVVRSFLEAHGIPVRTRVDDAGGTSPELNISNNLNLFVEEQSAEKALQLIADKQ